MLAKQIAAATRAAQNEITNGGSDFYAEIGANSSGNTPLWSGSFGGGSVLASTAAGVFSISKAIYAAYAAQAQPLTATDWPYLTMTSGYDTANGATCNQDNIQTVDACLLTFGSGNAAHVGKFSYDSMHMQRHADKVLTTSLGPDTRSPITSLYLATFGLVSGDLSMSSCTLAGGVIAKPTTLRKIAQRVMNGALNIKSYLQDANAPVNASTYFTDGSVVSSPAPADQPWQYKWGHWIEPENGGYWWAGSGGTVLWMDKSFSTYGLLFRVADGTGGEMGVQSIFALQRIRRAFLQGANKWLRTGVFGADGPGVW